MKRRITLAASQKKFERDLFPDRMKLSFEQWLEYKRRQEKRDSRESASDSESESESEKESRNAKAFAEWMKRQRERPKHGPEYVTVTELYRRKTRPLEGLIATDVELQNGEFVADSSENLIAYKQWREQFKQDQFKEAEDLETKKKKMEEKRQRLLSMAISYEEWMEHNEERKHLMKQILQASMEELNKIEEEKLKRRAPRQISFEKWKEKKKEHDSRDETPQEMNAVQQLHATRSSAAVPFDVWIKRKNEEQRSVQKKQQVLKQNRPNRDTGFQGWARGNGQEQLGHGDVKRESGMIKAMKGKHTYTVSQC